MREKIINGKLRRPFGTLSNTAGPRQFSASYSPCLYHSVRRVVDFAGLPHFVYGVNSYIKCPAGDGILEAQHVLNACTAGELNLHRRSIGVRGRGWKLGRKVPRASSGTTGI